MVLFFYYPFCIVYTSCCHGDHMTDVLRNSISITCPDEELTEGEADHIMPCYKHYRSCRTESAAADVPEPSPSLAVTHLLTETHSCGLACES